MHMLWHSFPAGFNLRQGPPPSAFSQFPPDVAATLARSELVRCKSSTRLGQLTSLTRLELDGCAVPDDLVAVSCLTDLQHLTISVMTHDPTGEAQRRACGWWCCCRMAAWLRLWGSAKQGAHARQGGFASYHMRAGTSPRPAHDQHTMQMHSQHTE